MKESTLMLALAVAGAMALVSLGRSLKQMVTAGEPAGRAGGHHQMETVQRRLLFQCESWRPSFKW